MHLTRLTHRPAQQDKTHQADQNGHGEEDSIPRHLGQPTTNQRGHASRAEITDAAIGQAAECVMLNKGPYINDAVQTLDDILRRMQDHKSKKKSMLRRLELAADFSGKD